MGGTARYWGMRRLSGNITLLMLLATTVLSPASGRAQRPDSAMAGRWEGRARMSVPFSTRSDLAVSLVIAEDGTVSGTVGDATLVGARLATARGAMGRALRIGREYMIEGALSGSLVRSEVMQRGRVVISLDWKNDTFVGELQTSGTHDGAPESQVITATGLVLHRT